MHACIHTPLLQAQSLELEKEVYSAFYQLGSDAREVLACEMALTGCAEQSYSMCAVTGGPAFLVYYGPAFLRQGEGDVFRALHMLAEVYRKARDMFPLSDEPDEAGSWVTIRIDEFKGKANVENIISLYAAGASSRLINMESASLCIYAETVIRLCAARALVAPFEWNGSSVCRTGEHVPTVRIRETRRIPEPVRTRCN